MATPPTLGYGQRGEAPIDAVNTWMRGQPWYQQLLQSFGQDPRNVHLSDDQKQRVIQAAQANGVVVDEGHNGQEIDDSGNFHAKSHALRNTLIVAGIAGAALLTAGAAGVFSAAAAPSAAGTVAGVEGGAYGVSAGTVAALGSGAMAAVPVTAATTAAISTAAATIGPAAAKAAAAKVAASGGAITAENILKYALPVAGSLVGGLIQANAQSNVSDAQQKYLEEALAYQKEQDAYNRTRQEGLDRQEVQRYGDYQTRIAPFIANGTSSNDRMAALLGLPARSGSSGGGSYGSQGSQGVTLSPEITARVLQNYKDLGVTPTGPGTGPTDSAYFAARDAETGGLTDANNSYWFGPTGRIAKELAAKGITGTPSTSAPSTSPAPNLSTQPQTRSATVQMRAPDGSVNTVSADQVAHYQALGATVIGAAA